MYRVIGRMQSERRVYAENLRADQVAGVAKSARFARCESVTIFDENSHIIARRAPRTGQAWVK